MPLRLSLTNNSRQEPKGGPGIRQTRRRLIIFGKYSMVRHSFYPGANHANPGGDLDLFPSPAAAETAVRWIPRGDWGCASDPSGRSVSIHNASYDASAEK
jgi:hypothetical protein